MAVIISAVCKIVEEKLKNFNFSMPMTAEQRVVFAEEFVDLYYTDTLEDLVMMFRYAIGGRIGKRYNTCDPRTLFEWYREYLEIKLSAGDNIREEKRTEQDYVKKTVPKELAFLVEKFKNKPYESSGKAATFEDFMGTIDTLPLHRLKNLKKQLEMGAVYDSFDKDIKRVNELIEKLKQQLKK